jgi:hypothetical protein
MTSPRDPRTETRIPSRVWSTAYRQLRNAGVSEPDAMARADVIRIECERAIEAEAQALAPSERERALRDICLRVLTKHDQQTPFATAALIHWDDLLAMRAALAQPDAPEAGR